MVKKYKNFETQLGESALVQMTDKAYASLVKKSEKSGIPTEILEEVYSRGIRCWSEAFDQQPEQFAFDRVNSFIADGFAAQLDEDLKSKAKKAVHVAATLAAMHGGKAADAAFNAHYMDPGYALGTAAAYAPKGMLPGSAAASALRATPANKGEDEYARQHKYGSKKMEEDNQSKDVVKMKATVKLKNIQGKKKSQALYDKLTRMKNRGVHKEDADPCWKNYEMVGMKNKNGRKVPNCVPKEEKENLELGTTARADYFKKMTPGQTIRKVAMEHRLKEDVATAASAPSAPAIAPNTRLGRNAPTQLSQSGGTQAKLNQTGNTFRNVSSANPASRSLTSGTARPTTSFNSAAPSQLKPTSVNAPQVQQAPAPKPSASFGQSSATPRSVTPNVNINQKIAQSPGTRLTQGLSDAGAKAKIDKAIPKAPEVVKAAERVAPAIGKLAKVAKFAGGPVVGAAINTLTPTPAGAGENEFQRQSNLAKGINPYKAQGRSVAQYEKDIAPKAKPVVAQTPLPKDKYSGFGDAYREARNRAAATGNANAGQFTYKNKTYTTQNRGENRAKGPLKQTFVQAEENE